jgi:mRNA-degrading endonuclease RelE of RelBE toxin-antitoxin system
MAGAYGLQYRPEVADRDLPAIPRNLQRRILKAIESRLTREPDRYSVRLRRSLWGLWKLRVGDYRVVYEIKSLEVFVWAIAHRRSVYEDLERRSTKERP